MPKILTPNDVLQFRQRLTDLALKAFAEHGIDGMSLRGLAAAAGCSRTTPYRYFRNKADILAAVRQAEFQRMADELERVALGESDFGEKLEALARAYLNFALDRPDAYRVMYSINQSDEQHYPELIEQISRSQQPMALAVKEAIDAGLIEGDPSNIGHIFWAGLHGIASLHLADKLRLGRGIEELTEVMIRSLYKAVACNPPGRPAAARLLEKQFS